MSRGELPYIRHIGMCRQRVWFLRRFGLNRVLGFAHFSLESSMVSERTTGVNERIYRFNSKCEKKRNMRYGIYEFFLLLF